tara:strand:+ start:123 stop:791 length:669 start_codon:yes stop_codon:yes gene_type:complete
MTAITGIADKSQNVGDMVSKLRDNNLDQDSFMKLLLAQLKMQNPENPFDSTTMMQQVSQLTNMASTQSLEKSIRELSTNMGASQVLQASEIIGKNVQVVSDRSPLTEKDGLHGSVILPEGVENVQVEIKDAQGQLVKTLPLSSFSDGVMDFHWDGLDEKGQKRAPDFYKISASGTLNGQHVALSTAGTYQVQSVALDRQGKGVIVNVDGLGGINMDEIIKIA